jgi:hypothetical protein
MLFGGYGSGGVGSGANIDGTARGGPGPNMAPISVTMSTSDNATIVSTIASMGAPLNKVATYPSTPLKNTIMINDPLFLIVDDNGVSMTGVFSDFSNLPIPLSVVTSSQFNKNSSLVFDCTDWLYKHLRFIGFAKEPKTQTDGGLSAGAVNGLVPNTGVVTAFIGGTTKILADSRNPIKPGQWLMWVLPDFKTQGQVTNQTRQIARFEPVPSNVVSQLFEISKFANFDAVYFEYLTTDAGGSERSIFLSTTSHINPQISLPRQSVPILAPPISATDRARYHHTKNHAQLYEALSKMCLQKALAALHVLSLHGAVKIQTDHRKKKNALSKYCIDKGASSDATAIKNAVNNIKNNKTADKVIFSDKSFKVESAGITETTKSRNESIFNVKKETREIRLCALMSLVQTLGLDDKNKAGVEVGKMSVTKVDLYMGMGNAHQEHLRSIFELNNTVHILGMGSDHNVGAECVEFLNRLYSSEKIFTDELYSAIRKLQRRVGGHSIYSSAGNPNGLELLNGNDDNPNVFVSITGASSF